MRLLAEDLQWEWLDDATLRLAFSLPPGSYATALLQELGQVTDALRVDHRSSEDA